MDLLMYNNSFANKEYMKKRVKETEYYILTTKLREGRYKLTILRNHSIINESYHNGLTAAKYSAFEWLISIDPSIFELNKVSMVHYKEDRPNGEPWVKDTNIELRKNFEAYFKNKITSQNARLPMSRESTQESKTWIFQGNPKIFDIDNYVNNHKIIWWSLRQEHYIDRIQKDDEVYLWRSDGAQKGTGGILAKCRVKSLPIKKIDDESFKAYWHTNDWENSYLVVELEVLDVRPEDGFISRITLLKHPVLNELLILRLRQQTNYLLPVEQAMALQKLWDSSKGSLQDVATLNAIGKLSNNDITDTEKEQIIKSRIGQSAFKNELLANEGKCTLCGVSDERFLIASHIKPWSQSNNQERLDVNNGLLLCPNHDALFDKGYISFDGDGIILVSESLDVATKVFLNINGTMNIDINERQQHYMEWHRVNIYKPR
ncbi:hypothetical protein GCM10009865_22170 [Aeromicrobium ponti]|uniref:EVE domain-containing protein n=1 Tax=Cytobacillus oceanisediminis TaxID=665099 RepID=A0A562JWC6_9BACI|nr:EVE domain-containing protein [Cytobacillus oceanisediminis]